MPLPLQTTMIEYNHSKRHKLQAKRCCKRNIFGVFGLLNYQNRTYPSVFFAQTEYPFANALLLLGLLCFTP
jgi:hypothetical protein